jgi:hypothetical protein
MLSALLPDFIPRLYSMHIDHYFNGQILRCLGDRSYYRYVSLGACDNLTLRANSEGYRKPFSASLLTGVSVPQ